MVLLQTPIRSPTNKFVFQASVQESPGRMLFDSCVTIRHYSVHVETGQSIRHAMAKNFFSILKSECIRIYKPETILKVQTFIDEYITIYNNESIPLSTKRSLFEKRRLFAQFAVILRLAVLFLSFPSGTVQLLGGLALFLQGTEKGKHFPKYLGLGKLFAIFLWILRFSTCNGRLECRIIMMNNIILYMGGDGICRRSVRGWARLKIILFYRLSRFCLC